MVRRGRSEETGVRIANFEMRIWKNKEFRSQNPEFRRKAIVIIDE